ncbi:MAG: alpha/beta hydrolase, partial [Dehalococcoidia bacterium]|nr:alpha/beta hydrolase [Dehalococcoidia bacterium]
MTSTQPNSKYITINDVRIRYLDWGTEGLPPLVCLHGHTGQAHIWDEFAEAMRGSYHVYALDQRGHGESGYASDGYARDRFVEDLAAFVDAIGLDRFTLAGLSMGGWHSMLYTADHPDRVERIVMVDIGPEPS